MPQKRGYKGPMRRATKQIQKALNVAERRRVKAIKGQRIPTGKEREKMMPQKPASSTSSSHSNQSSQSMDRMVTGSDLKQAFRGMSLAGGALGAGLGVNAVASGQFKNRRGGNPNSGIAPDRGGPPGGYRVPPPQTTKDPNARKESGPKTTPDTTVIVAPVAYGVTKKGSAPKMWAKARKGDVEVVVEHTEYVNDVYSQGAAYDPAAGMQYFANPGQKHLFPWLSTLAQNFDEYKFDYLEITYEPSVGTDSDGKFLATFDPDVLDEFPDTKQDMLEARVQLDSPIWTRSVLKVPKDLLEEFLFIRPGSLPAGADQHVYDCGVFNLINVGTSGAGLGELFVSYKCRLRTPNGGAVKEGYYTATSPSTTAPNGTALVPAIDSNIGLTWASSTTFYFDDVGTYLLTRRITGTNITNTGTLTAPAGSLAPTIAINAVGATESVKSWEIVVDNTDGLYTFSFDTATTVTAVSLRLFEHDLDIAP